MTNALLLVVASAVGQVGLVIGADVCDVLSDETSFLQSHIKSKMRGDDPPPPSQSSTLPLDCSKLGPLRALAGTWKSIQGVSIAYSPPEQEDLDAGRDHAERVHYYYTEEVKFTPLTWPVEINNRGVTIDAQSPLNEEISGLSFEQSVAKDSTTPGYHAEKGHFIFNVDPAAFDWEVARTGSSPRGMAWLAVGNSSWQPRSDVYREQERLNSWLDSNFEPQRVEELLSNLRTALYGQNGGFDETKIDLVLKGRYGDWLQDSAADLLRDAGDSSALQLQFSTTGGGGASMIAMPDINLQVSPENFTSTFWVLGNSSKPILQYFQNVWFRFGLSKSDSSRLDPACSSQPPPYRCMAKWPHLQFSTLIKVEDDEDCP